MISIKHFGFALLPSSDRPIGNAHLRATLVERKDDIDPKVPRFRRAAHLAADQSISDSDQTGADSDQTASDTDQSLSDRDQAASEIDQRVSDRDQAVSDRELAAQGPADVARMLAHEEARVDRGEGTMARMAATAVRGQIAGERHEQARFRDDVATRRDEIAIARDREAEKVDGAAEELAGQLGADSAATRVAAVARATAAAARASAARDREAAAHDREAAAYDRELLMSEIEDSHLDELTGAYRKQIGEVLVRHEIERARRMRRTLTLGILAVDEVTQAGGTDGSSIHPVLLGDVLLALQARLRLYDPIVRWGENEFVCAIAEVTSTDAQRRLASACSDIAKEHPDVLTSVGFATLEEGDTLDALIGRAAASKG